MAGTAASAEGGASPDASRGETLAAPGSTRLAGLVDVREFGARGDGTTLNTRALRQAIETCAAGGGGTVWFGPGRYLTGTLFLKSRVTLYFAGGATLLGSPHLEDYPATIPAVRSYTDNYTERSLIYAEQLEDVALEGQGAIDGQGAAFKGPYKVRPYLLRVVACRQVAVRGISLVNSPMWVQHYLACDGVLIDGITVRSKCNGNNDGIDIDGCHRVRIANCDIQSGDDAIVLKSTLDRPCRDVVVSNCILSSDCNAFKLGTESNGGFEDIVMSNCVLHDTRLAGIALETVDGGMLDRVSVQNVTMREVRCPLFIRLGNRARPFQEGTAKPGIGTLRRVNISNVIAVGANRIGCCLSGLPDHPIEDVRLENIRLEFAGGGTAQDAHRQPPERPEAYPEYSMFGPLPAYGLYCRHLRGLVLRDFRVGCATPDARPSLFCDDAESVEVSGWSGRPPQGDAPFIRFENVRKAWLQGCRAPEKTGTYLRVGGESTARIRLSDNDLAGAGKTLEIDPGVSAGAVLTAEPWAK